MKHIPFFSYIVLSLLLLASCTGRKETLYREALAEAKRQNLAYEPVTGDSLLRCAVDYFDRHGTANDRLLSRYLLGCAYRDLHEAPLALITWEDAVACADTLSPDCDYATLFRVYGQMADVYRRQHLPEKGLKAIKYFCRYSLQASDTTNYIRGKELQLPFLYELEDTSSIFHITEEVQDLYLHYGLEEYSASVYPTAIRVAIDHRQYQRAYSLMKAYEKSCVFDEYGHVERFREQYYYYKGLYFLGTGKLDSAEVQFRKLLPVEENAIDAYRGLLNLYKELGNADSVTKYATLYEDAVVSYLDGTKIQAILQAEGMYDYHRQQQIAQEQRQRANRLLSVFILCAVLVFVISSFVYFYYRQRKHEIKGLVNLLSQSNIELQKTKQEIALLQRVNAERNQLENLLEEKSHRVTLLEMKIKDVQTKLEQLKSTDKSNHIALSDIVLQFRSISHNRLVMENNSIRKVPARAANNAEWDSLFEAVRLFLPDFYTFIMENHKLSPKLLRVCILSRLNFKVGEMAVLLGVRKQSVTNARIALSSELFHANSALMLNSYLFDI